ncbi:ATP-binding protein [Halorhodospira halophila]|uniref:ATP-binding protein n=1 Tax=Halorhodospira halophila TaxID=1053 RepID=UPI001912E9E1|nr:hypothetical protein [Halorhodospira halophila]
MNAGLLLGLRLDSDLRQVAEACRAWQRLAGQLGLGEEASGAVEQALCEAVNNAIIHAHGQRAGYTVRITVRQDDDWLIVRIHDEGEATGPDLPPVEAPGGTVDLDEGGRGLRIIQALMWQVCYLRRPEGNTLEMRYPLPGGTED